jgi:hypothetical protein
MSVAEQKVVPAVVQLVNVVFTKVPKEQEPFEQDPTVMSGHSFTVDET